MRVGSAAYREMNRSTEAIHPWAPAPCVSTLTWMLSLACCAKQREALSALLEERNASIEGAATQAPRPRSPAVAELEKSIAVRIGLVEDQIARAPQSARVKTWVLAGLSLIALGLERWYHSRCTLSDHLAHLSRRLKSAHWSDNLTADNLHSCALIQMPSSSNDLATAPTTGWSTLPAVPRTWSRFLKG